MNVRPPRIDKSASSIIAFRVSRNKVGLMDAAFAAWWIVVLAPCFYLRTEIQPDHRRVKTTGLQVEWARGEAAGRLSHNPVCSLEALAAFVRLGGQIQFVYRTEDPARRIGSDG